jgi:hypothetical protein
MTTNTNDPELIGALNPAPAHTPPPEAAELGPKDLDHVGEPEDAVKVFSTASGSFAIVDAALLKGMEDNPLVQKAIVFPTKGEVAFEVKADYDDAVLRNLSMAPKEDPSDAGRIVPPEHESHDNEGSAEVVSPDMASPVAPSVAQQPVVPEGASPLSHDSSPERAIRKHTTPRSRRHMDGSDRYRKNSPVKKVMARLKRPSRHQPDVEEAFNFITKYGGKKVTEDVIKGIKNQALLADSIGLLMAMSMNGWQTLEEGVSNGAYEIADNRFEADKAGNLLFNEKPMPLNFNWLYEVRIMLQKSITESALNLGRTING